MAKIIGSHLGDETVPCGLTYLHLLHLLGLHHVLLLHVLCLQLRLLEQREWIIVGCLCASGGIGCLLAWRDSCWPSGSLRRGRCDSWAAFQEPCLAYPTTSRCATSAACRPAAAACAGRAAAAGPSACSSSALFARSAS